MSTMRRPSPFGELGWLQRQIDEVFDQAFGGPGAQAATTPWLPPVDVAKTADAFVYAFDLPGLTSEDVTLEAQNGMLVVTGNRRHVQDDGHEGYFLRERSYGSFTRSFSLPRGVRPDDITASFESGVLKVRVPLPEETKPKRIPVQADGRQLTASTA